MTGTDSPEGRKLYPYLDRAKILIVDDAPEWRVIVENAFAFTNAETFEAGDGEEALKFLLQARIRGEPFHLIVLDLVMPGMNGFKALEKIRSGTKVYKTPVVILTTKGAPIDVAECHNRGIAGYLLKPFEPERLLEVSEKAVAQFKQELAEE